MTHNLKTLGINTSGNICSIAILEGKNILYFKDSNEGLNHSVRLLPMINEAFETLNLNIKDIDLLGVCKGPGSFTGIRIGVASVHAFSDFLKVPAVGISSLEGLAYNAILPTNIGVQGIKQNIILNISESPEENIFKNDFGNINQNISQKPEHHILKNTFQKSNQNIFCSLIDAKHDNAYAGLFNYKNGKMNLIDNYLSDNIENILNYILNLLEPLAKSNQFSNITSNIDSNIDTDITSNNTPNINVSFIGDGAILHKDKIISFFAGTLVNPIFVAPEDELKNSPTAISIALAANIKYSANPEDKDLSLSPLYLKKSNAEIQQEAKKELKKESNQESKFKAKQEPKQWPKQEENREEKQKENQEAKNGAK